MKVISWRNTEIKTDPQKEGELLWAHTRQDAWART